MSTITPCRVWIRLQLPREETLSLQHEFADVSFVWGRETDQELKEIAAVFTDDPLPEELVRRMTALKWLHVTRGGVYPYLTPSIRERPIHVTGSKGIHGEAFSEFALACIFALAKKLPQCWQAQKGRRWEKVETEEIAGKTLGILGLGTVGSELARKARALGLRIIAIKRSVEAKPAYVDEIGAPDFLPKLLSEADFVVLCLASVPSTERILGEKELRSMKKGAYLINLTAGKAVEEKLLARALREGWIAGAALDAFARQPLSPDSELWGLPNVIISPRIGGAAAQKWELLMPIFAENLRRFRSQEKLLNLVDKERGY